MKITKQILKEIIDEELRDYVRGQSQSPEVEVPGGGVRTVDGVKKSVKETLETALQSIEKGDYSSLGTYVANLQAFTQALKKVGEIK